MTWGGPLFCIRHAAVPALGLLAGSYAFAMVIAYGARKNAAMADGLNGHWTTPMLWAFSAAFLCAWGDPTRKVTLVSGHLRLAGCLAVTAIVMLAWALAALIGLAPALPPFPLTLEVWPQHHPVWWVLLTSSSVVGGLAALIDRLRNPYADLIPRGLR